MQVLRIDGGRPVCGEVQVPGSKNAALAILSTVVLGQEPIVLHNVPDVTDVQIKIRLLRQLGAQVESREGSLFIDCSHLDSHVADAETVRPIRTGFYVLGPMLARVGKADIPVPGGCKIGARPVDYHLKGLAALGAKIELQNGRYQATAPRLEGCEIYLDQPSAGATQHLMSTAVLAHGITTIHNAAMEPEVVALADFLVRLGARIEGTGTSTITVTGVERLGGCEFRVPEDRLQAGTYLLAGAVTGGDVTVSGVLPEPQTALVNKLRETGLTVEEGVDRIRVVGDCRPTGISIKTMPYPGFPTDMQQPLSALLALASGSSSIEETLYESRIGHVQELNRMGADMRVSGRLTLINGVERLTGATVEATDLRAGAALVLAGLAAQGQTIIKNVHFIDRGYERFEQTLMSLGAVVERIGEHESERMGLGQRFN
ncbi:MAG: UDP-N-acetylglucosamine 1-carboxyvinyltransferase [Fimbriimonadaceae bacterium]|nr:UDP-N-acetylglucosamine 1-carboxyvinyltransferase [Fimbriimonadaceae bacterium]QYK58666.1 MAG: UDP-N-acetylglucosamine 1-carboxyvinyltransferase [Fimbriimonadaceae bacterium]